MVSLSSYAWETTISDDAVAWSRERLPTATFSSDQDHETSQGVKQMPHYSLSSCLHLGVPGSCCSLLPALGEQKAIGLEPGHACVCDGLSGCPEYSPN